MRGLERVQLTGFKSIREMDLQLRPLNVLIGANGAGKSNFASFFRMLNFAMSGSLQVLVAQWGGADSVLFYGAKTTPQMEATLEFATDTGRNRYHMRLVHAAPDRFIFADEAVCYVPTGGADRGLRSLGSGHAESALLDLADTDKTAKFAKGAISRWRFYQFHDTSAEAAVRKQRYANDSEYLRADAGNLPAFLNMLRQRYPESYGRIRTTIQMMAPFIGDFRVEPLSLDPKSVMLNWVEPGRDVLFGPHQLSDGTLRMIALTTLLLQPENLLPSLIVVDEPELGLHPYAVSVIAALLKGASQHTQVVVATQSVALVSEFGPEDIVVADREDGGSVFRRQDPERLAAWLEDYSLGELWEKNVIGGRPA
jgi:predicted ATPase